MPSDILRVATPKGKWSSPWVREVGLAAANTPEDGGLMPGAERTRCLLDIKKPLRQRA